MQVQTHYTTLGLAPTAPIPVLRAAYKALVLTHHPDKLVHLSASERASHSATFRSVQEAFDILGNPSLKASYDTELARHHGTVDIRTSTFHHEVNIKYHSLYTRTSSIRLTTADEKGAMKLKTETALMELRNQRTTRDLEEANLKLVDLKFMLRTWKDLAHENKSDAIMFAHCTIMIHEYEAKVAQKEAEHDNWMNNMATPKQVYTAQARYVTPTSANDVVGTKTPGAPKKMMPKGNCSPFSSSNASSPSPSEISSSTPSSASLSTEKVSWLRQSRGNNGLDSSSKHPETQHECQSTLRKTQQVKAAAVSTDKEAQREKIKLLARKEVDIIARVRAKVAPDRSTEVRVNSKHGKEVMNINKSRTNHVIGERILKVCVRCGEEHKGLIEWKTCIKAVRKKRDTIGEKEAKSDDFWLDL